MEEEPPLPAGGEDSRHSAPSPSTRLLVTLLLLLLPSLPPPVASHPHCSHHYPRDHQVLPTVHLEEAHEVRKRSAEQELRIKLYYDESVYRLTKQQYNLIHETVLPSAVTYWGQALRVRKTENRIRLNRKCQQNQVFFKSDSRHPYCKNKCEEVTMCGEVGEREAGSGIVNADFVFYISATETERCQKGMTVAYAAHCQQEAALDRPIAGHANLCPSSISTKPQELEILLSTVKHEMLHALGFSVSLFAFYRDEDGDPLTPRGDNGKPRLNEELQTRQWSDNTIRKEKRYRAVRASTDIRSGLNVKEA